MNRLSLPLIALFLSVSACGPEPVDTPGAKVLPVDPVATPVERIDLMPHVPDGWSVEAVAIDGDRILSLLLDRGILVTDRAGTQLDLLVFGDNGLPDLGYGDLDVLPDGRLVFAAPNEAVTWDPETHLLESYFCLEPGWGEVVMVNQTLTVDTARGHIIGAPTYYDTSVSWDDPSSSSHVAYGLDGELIGVVDVLASRIVA